MGKINEIAAIDNVAAGLIQIPQGEITLRDDRIKRNWTIKIEPFYLAKYPVTQTLYDEIMNQQPSAFKGKNRPVESVSWKEAVLFCNALSLKARLEPCYLPAPSGDMVLIQKLWVTDYQRKQNGNTPASPEQMK